MKYRLLMNGRNFLVDMDEHTGKYGFFQNVFLESHSPEAAELAAVEKIRQNEDLKAITKNTGNDPPLIFLQTLWELESSDGSDNANKGRVWYREKKWWQFLNR